MLHQLEHIQDRTRYALGHLKKCNQSSVKRSGSALQRISVLCWFINLPRRLLDSDRLLYRPSRHTRRTLTRTQRILSTFAFNASPVSAL